jgi:hypothetical protein
LSGYFTHSVTRAMIAWAMASKITHGGLLTSIPISRTDPGILKLPNLKT